MKKYKVILKCGKVWSSLFNSPIQAMKELGASNIGGIEEVMLIEERVYVVGKINALQKQVEAGEINFYLFYKEVIAMKHSIENKVM